jgi:gamma-glutamyltranspeptidase / glutathione hydrolase
MKKALPLALLMLIPITTLGSGVAGAASVPAPAGTGGAVASADPLATAAGLAVLRAGGNAVDAAVATALVLAVVYPEAGNLGGGGFALVRMGGELQALDFRETAPARAKPDMYLDSQGKPVENASLVGPLAAGVPGSPAGLWELQRRFGRLPWPKVVEFARRLAAEGFIVSHHLHHGLSSEENHKLLLKFPETVKMWLPNHRGENGGEAPAVGSILRQPDLAATLARYAEHGPRGIVTGAVAEAVEKA